MGEADANRRLVRLVSDGLRRSRSEREMVACLIAAGIPDDEAPEVFAAIRQALRAGVQAALTDGLSAPDGPPADPLLAEAFREGQTAFRGSVRRVWVERGLIAVVALGAVVAAATRLLGLWGR